MTASQYPDSFIDFLDFLCKKYRIDSRRIFVEYSSSPPPPLRGNVPGYYDGLLSHRERLGNPEFLITVYTIARNPLLTLGHEFAHLVEDLKHGKAGEPLRTPDAMRERELDVWAARDLEDFRRQRSGRGEQRLAQT